jgi:hypothetical protein
MNLFWQWLWFLAYSSALLLGSLRIWFCDILMQAMLFHPYLWLLQKDGPPLFQNNFSLFQEFVLRATLSLSLDCGIVWPDSYMDSIDSSIKITFRLLHPLPSRYSWTHLKIINIHIWQKLASAVGMSWYVTWEEYVLQRRKIIWICNSIHTCKPRCRSLKRN